MRKADPEDSTIVDCVQVTDFNEVFVHSIANRSIWQRIADFLFGYDFFISYASRDGATYAAHLAKGLKQRGYDCFLDVQSFAKGDDWKLVGTAAIRRTSQLVLVGSPSSLQSAPVLHEVRVFTSTGRKVIPIDFDGTLEEAIQNGTPLAQFITLDILRIKESMSALAEGPADKTFTDLQGVFVNRRQSWKRMRALQAIASTLALLLVMSILFWRLSERRRIQADMATQTAERRRQEAEAATALAVKNRNEADAAKLTAEEQRDVATIRQLVAVSNQIRSAEPQRIELSILLAAEAISLARSMGKSHQNAFPEAGTALREGLGKLLFPVRSGAYRSLIKPPSIEQKKGLLLSADEKRLWLYNARSGKTTILANSPGIRSAALVDGGKVAVFCSADHRLNIVTVGSKNQRSLEGACDEVLGAQGVFVSMTKDASIVYDPNGKKITTIPDGFHGGAAISPNGNYIAIVHGSGISVWQTHDAKEVELEIGPFHAISKVVFSPGSNMLAISGDVGDVVIKSLRNQNFSFNCLCGGIATAFSPGGSRFLATRGDATRIWSTKQKGELHPKDAFFTEPGDSSSVNDVAFGIDSNMILSAGDDQLLRLIDRQGTAPRVRYGVHPRGVENVMFVAANSGEILSIDKTGALRQWKSGGARGQVSLSIGQHARVEGIEFSPDGRYAAAFAFIEETFQNNEDTQDAHMAGDLNHTVFLWDLRDSLSPSMLEVDDDINGISFSWNSKYLWAQTEGSDAYWQTADFEEAADGDAKPAFDKTPWRSGRERIALSAERQAVLHVKDCSLGETSVRAASQNANVCVASPKRDFVAIANGRTVTVWRMSDLANMGSVTHEGAITFVGFHPSASWVASGSEDGGVRLWNFDPEFLLQETCGIVHRNLTRDEWKEYLGAARPYRKLCPGLP